MCRNERQTTTQWNGKREKKRGQSKNEKNKREKEEKKKHVTLLFHL